MSRRLAGVAGLALLMACAQPAPEAEVPTVDPEAVHITSARLGHNALLEAADIDSAATFWTEDILVLAGLGSRIEGRAAMSAAFRADTGIFFRRLPDEVQVSSHWPIAWERGTWTGRSRADPDSVFMTGWYSARWIREDGRWRIQSEQFVADGCSGDACQRPLAARPD